MVLAPCSRAHAREILDIFNHEILHTTALYEYEPRTLDFMEAWFDARERGNFPVQGAFAADGTLSGFASYGAFRAFPAYRHTVEHSVYVRADRRAGGIGRALMRELIDTASARGVHVMVGVIDSTNAASAGLHRALGFSHTGTLREVGYKFGRWLDVDLYQLNFQGTTGMAMA